MRDLPDRATLTRLLAAAGLSPDYRLTALPGGANNQVYRVEAGDACALLKVYFRHPDDPRDRLEAEYGFCTFAWDHGLRCLPQPLAADPAAGLALYEFVCGTRLEPGEVGAEEVGQALAFYQALNTHKRSPEAAALPPGSEACFTLEAHLDCVARRVQRLADVPAEVAHFVRDELAPAWQAVAASLHDADLPLPEADRCLSPSDFGFHNALREADGCLRFLDFEYAGWDDPAKLVCDFFCQPAVPVPPKFHAEFAAAVAAGLSDPDLHRRRFAALLPVYRIKWCCILLNDFLPEGSARRQFAARRALSPERAAAQLAKARAMLASLDPSPTRDSRLATRDFPPGATS